MSEIVRQKGQPPSASIAVDEKTVAWLDPALQKGFTQVPNAVLRDPRLTLQARIVYAVLASFAWQGEECFPGQARVAGLLNISPRYLRTRVSELERAGLVQVRRRGLTQTNVYRLLPARPSDRNQGSDQDRISGSDKEDSKKNTRLSEYQEH